VHLTGKSNSSIEAGAGKPIRPQPSRARATVFKGGEPTGCDPKPGDLCVGKVKRAERHVEAC